MLSERGQIVAENAGYVPVGKWWSQYNWTLAKC
jgi:hypothetical protein